MSSRSSSLPTPLMYSDSRPETTGGGGSTVLVVGTPDARPVHRMLAEAWRPGDAAFAELVRAALVLCADHELNVSAFAARVVASTGAHLHATVCAGLAALSGPRHGGATSRVFALLDEACTLFGPRPTLLERDFNFPPYAELVAELGQVREVLGRHAPEASRHARA